MNRPHHSAPDGKPPGQSPGGKDLVALTVSICLGIIRDQRTRRSVLFFVMIGVIAMLFGGIAIYDRWLEKRTLLFLLHWGACLWFTFLCILLALYDMLMVRKAAIMEKRRLAEEMKQEILRNQRTRDGLNQ